MFDAARNNILYFIEKNSYVEMGVLEALLATYMVVGAIVVAGMFVILAKNLRGSRSKALFNECHLSRKVFFYLFF